MSDVETTDDLYGDQCQKEFGESAPSMLKFLTEYRKRGMKPDDPLRDFTKVVGSLFNDGLLLHLRASVWESLEERRTRRGQRQEQVAAAVALVPSTYSKIQAGRSTLDSILLLLRPLGLELRDLRLPSQGEQTVAALLYVLPLVKYEALGHNKPSISGGQHFTREDVEWLLHLDAFGRAWLSAFLEDDATRGAVIAACGAASISIRLGKAIDARPFAALGDLWDAWSQPWKLCMDAIPTGKLV